MGSKQLATRMLQKASLEEKIRSRLEVLKAEGKQVPDRDPILRKLKADLRQLNQRIEAIEAVKKTYESVRATKDQRQREKKKAKEEPTEEGPSKRQLKKETKKQERVKKAIEKKQLQGQA